MKNSIFEELIKTMATLRSPSGCMWDREQTHESIKSNLIEETYEVIDAIESKNPEKLKEELGDVLLQIIFHSQMAKENNQFDVYDVIKSINDKLIRRHPHVFGNTDIKDTKDILNQWEKIKKQEVANKDRKSITDGIPKHLPVLLKALKIQKQVSRIGFDWKSVDGVINKVEEELEEIKQAHNEKQALSAIKEEIGDLLFATINLARYLDICPEEALHSTIIKFQKRFQYIEENIQKKFNKDIHNATSEEMEQLWIEAKQKL